MARGIGGGNAAIARRHRSLAPPRATRFLIETPIAMSVFRLAWSLRLLPVRLLKLCEQRGIMLKGDVVVIIILYDSPLASSCVV